MSVPTYKPAIVASKGSQSRSKPILDEIATLDATSPICDYPILRYDFVKTATASIYAESTFTKLICSIYGPRASQVAKSSEQGALICDFRYSPFAQSTRKQRQHLKDENETLFGSILEQSLAPAIQLDKLPKHEIVITIQILQTSGYPFYDLLQAYHTISNALAETGIGLYDIPCASLVFLHPSSSSAESAAVKEEQQQHKSQITYIPKTNPGILRAQTPSLSSSPALFFCVLPSTQQVVYSKLIGPLKDQDMWDAISTAALQSCEIINTHTRQQVRARAIELLTRKLQNTSLDDGDDDNDDDNEMEDN